MIRKVDKKNKFVSIFNPETGFYVRSGVIENGKDTGIDPFMTSYPELLDIGIMQTCVCAHRCNVDCYQKALTRKGSNMSVEDFRSILDQSKGKMFQCLYENEVVLTNEAGNISSKYIKDVRVGDYVYCGNNSFAKVVEKNEKISDIYEIDFGYGKKIQATNEHRFPTNNGLKTVEDIKIGDELIKGCTKYSVDEIKKIDLVKLIIAYGLERKYFIYDCPGIEELCKKYNIKMARANNSVLIANIKNYLNEIDYSTASIGKERVKYRFNAVYDISAGLMKLLGHYVGNGSYRTYTISNKQEKMISTIEHVLQNVFPQFPYTKNTYGNVCRIEVTSSYLHKDLFDNILKCRCEDGEKQLPNFIFGVSREMKEAFLQGYFCDGNMRIQEDDGMYGELIFNTSSDKLYRDTCLLLNTIDVDYSVRTEIEKQCEFSKNDRRIINRKTRYRIVINNLIKLSKIPSVANDHRNGEFFNQIIHSNHNPKYLRERKGYIVKGIDKLNEKKRVIDINIDSDDHLFVTSHGVLTHNCALGGAGDVDTHENFEEIVRLCREYNIVPNFTTSGIAMTKEKAEICKKYCGAVAVSEHFSDYTDRAIDMLLEAGVKTNIHYVLSKKTIDMAIDRLKNNSFKKGINAVVFLLYKPVGFGKEENMLTADDPKVKEFFKLIDTGNFHHKCGFDSCSASGIVNYTSGVNLESLDYCEGGRFSAYIDANMNMMPCSFANQDPSWFVSLRDHTIQEAWDSEIFNKFRYSLHNSCKGCSKRECCAGGCPLVNQITLCNREERNFVNEAEK